MQCLTALRRAVMCYVSLRCECVLLHRVGCWLAARATVWFCRGVLPQAAMAGKVRPCNGGTMEDVHGWHQHCMRPARFDCGHVV